MTPTARWWRRLVVVVLGMLGVVACAGARTEPTLYERLGGAHAIYAVVDDFVGRVTTDSRVNRYSRARIFRSSANSSRSSSARRPAGPAPTWVPT